MFLCGNTYHRIYDCEKFKNTIIPARKLHVFRTGCCFNCFGREHIPKDCKTKYT